jgi:hypothetical protein
MIDWENCGMKMPHTTDVFAAGLTTGLAICAMVSAKAGTPSAVVSDVPFTLAQAMVPPTGMADAEKPMPMEERMRRRFPQPVRVGDLIGLPVLDDDDSTIGFVRQVARTPQDKIKLIVSYGGWFGWGTRPVAVPIAAVAILGRELASLDMPPSEYKAAPTWQGADATALPDDATILVALGRR